MVAAGGGVALTGAGISTASGIPDYRGPTGASRTGRPMTYREFTGDAANRRRYWARSHAGWRLISDAEPNPGHRALAEMEAAGLVDGVITQNVDDLHRAAGSRQVIDLHGSLGRTICLDCGDVRSRLELSHRLTAANPVQTRSPVAFAADGDASIDAESEARFVVVDCLGCGGVLKPDIVFFGENVPRSRVDEAMAWLGRADWLLVLGSSLTVMSGYRFVLAARRLGIPVAIVNLGPTRGDSDAAVRIEADLCETLGGLAARLVPTASR